MKTTYFIIISIITISILSCNGKNNKKSSYKLDSMDIKKDDSTYRKEKKDTVFKTLLDSIDIISIKKQYGRGSTSTFLSKENSKLFSPPDTDGFYGLYYIVNQDINVRQAYIATIVIYAKEKPWRFSNNNETLIEFTSYSSKIPLIRKLNVGYTKDDLINLFGEPKRKKEDILFYQDDENVILSVKINKNIITAYKVGRYSHEIDFIQLTDEITSKFNLPK